VTILSDRFRSGVHPGLPAPKRKVPFGQVSTSQEELGLMPTELKLVVALVAAEFTQMGPVSGAELGSITGVSSLTHLSRLEKAGWIRDVGRIPRTTGKLYAPTARAWRELGFVGWSLLKEVAA
jgi:hypothetical protein